MYFLEKVRFPKMRVLGGLQKKSNSVEILSYFTDSHRVQFFLALFLNGMYGSYSTIVISSIKWLQPPSLSMMKRIIRSFCDIDSSD